MRVLVEAVGISTGVERERERESTSSVVTSKCTTPILQPTNISAIGPPISLMGSTWAAKRKKQNVILVRTSLITYRLSHSQKNNVSPQPEHTRQKKIRKKRGDMQTKCDSRDRLMTSLKNTGDATCRTSMREKGQTETCYNSHYLML